MFEDEDGTLVSADEEEYYEGGARKKRRGPAGCLAALVGLAVLVGGFYFAVTRGVEFISDQFAAVEDYPGPGTGKVLFEVKEGDTVAQMGRGLKDEGVVASVQAFIDAAADEPKSNTIQVGFYELQKEMRAADALAILMDPSNQSKNTVTIPEGLRVTDTLDILAKQTKFSRPKYEQALTDPAGLGLPDWAEGNFEGYLFPATYEIGPKDKPADILAAMIARWRQAADTVELEARADELGYTPAELMTIASLVEAEGRGDDMPKIARVIMNRLENPDNGVTYGLLQIDATVNFALGRQGVVAVTEEDLQVDSPYNTYKYPGLPPGPVEAPGEQAMAAAANPAEGDWLFYVTVDLATGETKFTESYEEFLQFKAEFKQYCETSDAC